jgi:hypothetical protein
MTGSNHCFSKSSDKSRRGEKRLTDAENESTAIDIDKHLDQARASSGPGGPR